MAKKHYIDKDIQRETRIIAERGKQETTEDLRIKLQQQNQKLEKQEEDIRTTQQAISYFWDKSVRRVSELGIVVPGNVDLERLFDCLFEEIEVLNKRNNMLNSKVEHLENENKALLALRPDEGAKKI